MEIRRSANAVTLTIFGRDLTLYARAMSSVGRFETFRRHGGGRHAVLSVFGWDLRYDNRRGREYRDGWSRHLPIWTWKR